jgi:hypothetical protein
VVGAGFGGLSLAKGLAALLKTRAAGRDLSPFRYRDYGSVATSGRKRAILQHGKIRLSGLFAWLLWSLTHIYFLIGFRNRLSVTTTWAWSCLTFQRGTRLITGISGARPDPGNNDDAQRRSVRRNKTKMVIMLFVTADPYRKSAAFWDRQTNIATAGCCSMRGSICISVR